MSFNLSELFEIVVQTVPDREALVTPARRLTYRELDDRADRVATWLSGRGIGRDDHIGLHMLNGTEYIECMLGAYKLSAVPVNINYRYVARELSYLYDNADLVGLVFHRRFTPAVDEARAGLDRLSTLLVVDDTSDFDADGAVEYETALSAAEPTHHWPGRSGDDHYISYTGGTTGLPKGVVWRHEDLFFAALGGGDPVRTEGPISRPEQLAERVTEFPMTNLTAPPFMHVSAHWGAFNVFYAGGRVLVPRPGPFDAAHVWDLIEAESANIVTLVGDAMVRPFLDEYEATRRNAQSLLVLASGGAPLSDSSKARARELLGQVIILDGYGSTELGVTSTASDAPGTEMAGRSTFELDDRTAVFDDEMQPVEPGSGVIGHLARSGRLPLGYYGDDDKTAATFVERDGVRWALSGDFASVEPDGRVVLYGRGSVSINSGGEKVFPEEVEKVLVGIDQIADAVVVGVPDERWGSRVCAVVSLKPGTSIDLNAVQQHCRSVLAGYKVPRDLVTVETVERSPSGKADYPWAQRVAIEECGG